MIRSYNKGAATSPTKKDKAMETTKKEEFTKVQRADGKFNFIDRQGKILSNEWFSYVEDFENGIARVQRSDKQCNYINKKGKILSDEWFYAVLAFKDGFAKVQRTNGELCKIDKNGKIVVSK